MSLAQLSRLLPLPNEDLQQILDYANTLSPQEAADHFNNLLGESSQSIEFISSFNARRQPASKPVRSNASSIAPSPASTPPPQEKADSSEVPRRVRGQKKKKAPLHSLPPRQVDQTSGPPGTAYQKADVDDYMSQRKGSPLSAAGNRDRGGTAENTVRAEPSAKSKPGSPQAAGLASTPVVAPSSRLPPSAAGSLISDTKKSRSAGSSRTASPAPKTKTKVNITGGTSMQGASTTLQELDSAIRALEITTNPTLSDDVEKRRCNCIGARHPVLEAAPNCLNCGKVICVKEGLGPCTFCGTPLLSATEVQSMVAELRAERGREKMALDAAAHRKADAGKGVVPFASRIGGGGGFSNSRAQTPALGQAASTTNPDPQDSAAARALAHRDKLLNFQAQNAKRTTVHDEAADFETPDAGTSIWASPAERARQLKKQQQVLAQQAWNARPEYEKKRTVVSIDLVGGKAVRRVQTIDIPRDEVVPSFDSDDGADGASGADGDNYVLSEADANSGGRSGAFSRNPLLGSLIRPKFEPQLDGEGHAKGKGKAGENGENADAAASAQSFRKSRWRRVQDDLNDNEDVILDGGVYGRR